MEKTPEGRVEVNENTSIETRPNYLTRLRNFLSSNRETAGPELEDKPDLAKLEDNRNTILAVLLGTTVALLTTYVVINNDSIFSSGDGPHEVESTTEVIDPENRN